MAESIADRGSPDPQEHGRVEALVRGRVQGVGFRYFVIDEAEDLGLTGWVANEPGGGVRCVAEGPRESLDRLLERLREGPPSARVHAVDVSWGEPTGEFDRFSVRFGSHRGD